MRNLNQTNTIGQSGWDRLSFWLESEQYWSDRYACYGDEINVRDVKVAQTMVHDLLTGEWLGFPEK